MGLGGLIALMLRGNEAQAVQNNGYRTRIQVDTTTRVAVHGSFRLIAFILRWYALSGGGLLLSHRLSPAQRALAVPLSPGHSFPALGPLGFRPMESGGEGSTRTGEKKILLISSFLSLARQIASRIVTLDPKPSLAFG